SLILSSPYSVFYYSSVSHRYLHSFPTRRSSDLAHTPASFAQLNITPEENDIQNILKIINSHFKIDFSGYKISTVGRRIARRIQIDRKSTRLNSSHVKISYAVFCLKKKKE